MIKNPCYHRFLCHLQTKSYNQSYNWLFNTFKREIKSNPWRELDTYPFPRVDLDWQREKHISLFHHKIVLATGVCEEENYLVLKWVKKGRFLFPRGPFVIVFAPSDTEKAIAFIVQPRLSIFSISHHFLFIDDNLSGLRFGATALVWNAKDKVSFSNYFNLVCHTIWKALSFTVLPLFNQLYLSALCFVGN